MKLFFKLLFSRKLLILRELNNLRIKILLEASDKA